MSILARALELGDRATLTGQQIAMLDDLPPGSRCHILAHRLRVQGEHTVEDLHDLAQRIADRLPDCVAALSGIDGDGEGDGDWIVLIHQLSVLPNATQRGKRPKVGMRISFGPGRRAAVKDAVRSAAAAFEVTSEPFAWGTNDLARALTEDGVDVTEWDHVNLVEVLVHELAGLDLPAMVAAIDRRARFAENPHAERDRLLDHVRRSWAEDTDQAVERPAWADDPEAPVATWAAPDGICPTCGDAGSLAALRWGYQVGAPTDPRIVDGGCCLPPGPPDPPAFACRTCGAHFDSLGLTIPNRSPRWWPAFFGPEPIGERDTRFSTEAASMDEILALLDLDTFDEFDSFVMLLVGRPSHTHQDHGDEWIDVEYAFNGEYWATDFAFPLSVEQFARQLWNADAEATLGELDTPERNDYHPLDLATMSADDLLDALRGALGKTRLFHLLYWPPPETE